MQIDLTKIASDRAESIITKKISLLWKNERKCLLSKLTTCKTNFQAGAKKEDKINPNHEYYQMVSSYKTMESYRRVWNNFLTIF